MSATWSAQPSQAPRCQTVTCSMLPADAAGTIRWIDVHRDYTTRTEPEQVLQAITQTIS